VTFTWWLIPIVALFGVLIAAPWIGKQWALREEEQRRWVPEARRRRWRQ
jgi:hypothetical protein